MEGEDSTDEWTMSLVWWKLKVKNTMLLILTKQTQNCKATLSLVSKFRTQATLTCPSRGGVILKALRSFSGALKVSKNLNLELTSAVSTTTSSTTSLERTTSSDTCLETCQHLCFNYSTRVMILFHIAKTNIT